jgi:hypothetical protein
VSDIVMILLAGVGHRRVRVWPSVLKEIRQIRTLLPASHAFLRRSWRAEVRASDACLSGVSAIMPQDEIMKIVHHTERWRCRVESAYNARAHALFPERHSTHSPLELPLLDQPLLTCVDPFTNMCSVKAMDPPVEHDPWEHNLDFL